MANRRTALTYCEVTSDGSERQVSWPLPRMEADLSDFSIGTEVGGRYVLRYKLGQGGMGCVFLAHDNTPLDRDVALKVDLRFQNAETDVTQLDLAREAKLAALVEHEGIASVYDFGIHAGKPFTIFEFVAGNDLRKVMEQKSHWTVPDVRAVVEPIADALDSAHASGVIHSDLKPENICLTPSGLPKILDFGIARELNKDFDNPTFRGTAAYASPEQAGCRPGDGRSDQYALGLIAYELLAGRRPFLEDEPLMQLHLHEYEPPPNLREFRPELPESVVNAVMRSLEKRPDDRFATCREFASAFAIEGEVASANITTTNDIHISETSSDSLVAKRLATELEAVGYSIWYYQRDALPGIPLSRQVNDSLQTSQIALLLISRASLATTEFADEVLSAHRLGRTCLPILVDMSLEEFQSHQPVWRPVLGTAAIIELDRDDFAKTLQRIKLATEQLGVAPSKTVTFRSSGSRSTSTQIWATDANQIDINELDDIVFRNEVINEFLTRRNKFFLTATKGLGKTLLLTFKRHLITTQQREGEDSLCLIPTGRPYLDFMSEMRSLAANYEKPLSDLTNCKRLWGAALRISVLSHHSSLLDPEQQFELTPFPPRIQRWLKGANVQPSVVFKELTSLKVSSANRLIDDTENFLDEQIRRVHDSTLVFVDKVDQAVRRMSRDSWINIQAGLIEAAWDLINANSHVKVYASIRQEAFANYESDIKTNLLGATTALRYSDDELRGLVDRLSGCYEGTKGFKEFVGVNVIKHPRRPFPEDSFEFLRRYTLGRPRDFVAIASELSAGLTSLDEQEYVSTVRRASAMGLVANVFDETQVFLDCLGDKSSRLRFLNEIPANILTREAAIAASARFNGLPEESMEHFDEDAEEIFHPFRDLFLAGLLGVIRRNDQDHETQRFRQPDDVLNDASKDLPNSTHYFIHPALSEYIQQHRQSKDFRYVQQVLVGENAPWHSFDATICQIEAELVKVTDPDLRNEVHRLLAYAKTILQSAKPKNVRVELESSTDWNLTRERLLREGYDDVILWFEELLLDKPQATF